MYYLHITLFTYNLLQVRSGRVKEELVQCIQTLLVSQMKREAEPSHESTVEEDERIPNVGHITVSV